MFTEKLQSDLYALGASYIILNVFLAVALAKNKDSGLLEIFKTSYNNNFVPKAKALGFKPNDINQCELDQIKNYFSDFDETLEAREYTAIQKHCFYLGASIVRYLLAKCFLYEETKQSVEGYKNLIEQSLLILKQNRESIRNVFQIIDNTGQDIKNPDSSINQTTALIQRTIDEIKAELSRYNETKYSSIDRSRPILDTIWVLSLVRKPGGTHAEHAFLILEGKQADRSVIWFMDLVGNPILPGMGNGKVRIVHCSGELDEELLFRCDRRMMDIRKGDRLLYASWNISSDKGKQLVNTVTQAQAHPPKFNILGQRSLFAASTGASSSVATGHNCFTWAKSQLRDLNDPCIQLPMDDLQSWIFSATSRLLVDHQPPASFWYQRPVAIAAMVGAAAVGGFVAGNPEVLPELCLLQ